MKLAQMAKMAVLLGILVTLAATFAAPQAKEKSTAARLVVWQPKAGQNSAFEEGYKRHLEWHRKASDTWKWYGWNIISGERDGYFVDGTFFHPWTDLDTPVSPAEDGANNAVNVEPYGDARSVAAYETTPALTHLDSDALKAPLLTFYYVGVQPGRASEFESAAATELAKMPASVRCAIFRPVTGTSEHLLIVASDKASELGQQGATARRLFENISRNVKANVLISLRSETGRFRRDMSNLPGETSK